MNVTTEVVVDLLKLTKNVIHVVQDDSTRIVRLKVLCGESPYDLSDDLDAGESIVGLVAFRQADGHGGEYDTTSEGYTAVELESGSTYIWNVRLDANVFSVAGWCQLNVKFRTSTGKVLQTFAIDVDVQPSASPESGSPGDFYNVLSIADIRAALDELYDRLNDFTASENTIVRTARYNNMISVAEIENVAKSYYDVRGEADNARFYYDQVNPSCFDSGFQAATQGGTVYQTSRNIDCSTFVGLLLRGIPFNKSPYQYLPLPSPSRALGGDEDDDDDGGDTQPGDGGSGNLNDVPANADDYSWAVNPSIYKESKEEGDTPTYIRTASQIGQWMAEHGMAIPLLPDFENIQPGDIIFWAKKTLDGAYRQGHRYLKISHIAICYSVLPRPENVIVSNESNGLTVTINNTDTARAYLHDQVKAGNLPKTPRETAGKIKPDEKIGYGYYQATKLSNGKWEIMRRILQVWQEDETIEATESELGITTSGSSTGSTFDLTVFPWSYLPYKHRHTIMEVTNIPPYVLNRTLEKVVPDEVVLIARPELGAANPNDYAGSVNTDLGITNVNNLFRPGFHFLNSSVTGGLPTGYNNGTGCAVRVEKSMMMHSGANCYVQTFFDVVNGGAPLTRTLYSYSAGLDPDAWTTWV